MTPCQRQLSSQCIPPGCLLPQTLHSLTLGCLSLTAAQALCLVSFWPKFPGTTEISVILRLLLPVPVYLDWSHLHRHFWISRPLSSEICFNGRGKIFNSTDPGRLYGKDLPSELGKAYSYLYKSNPKKTTKPTKPTKHQNLHKNENKKPHQQQEKNNSITPERKKTKKLFEKRFSLKSIIIFQFNRITKHCKIKENHEYRQQPWEHSVLIYYARTYLL